MDTSGTSNRNRPAQGGQPNSSAGSGGDYSLPGAPEGLGSLISGIIADLQGVLRGEVQLAKVELKEDARNIGTAAGLLGAGVFFALISFIFLMLAVTYLLSEVMELWIAAAIVGVALLIIAAILAMTGKKKLSTANVKPEQTIETLKEDQQWANRQIKSVKK